jgi:LPXTG-motif cell wall-anchored protein
VESTDSDGNKTVRFVQVLGRQVSAPPILALTGSDNAPLLLVAIASIGFGIVLLGRQRRVKRDKPSDR